jgi:mannose-6-phosphate isomerase-like protein (cupin superfamily)
MSVQLSTPRAESAEPTSPLVIPHEAGRLVDLDGFGIHWKLDGLETGKRFSVVHHPIAPRHLAAPLHRHHREDEFSYVLSGKMGALLGDDVVVAEAGTWVAKPRNQWHSFRNAGDTPCEIIEIISPAGFEDYFRELAAIWPDLSKAEPILKKYELDLDPTSVPQLCARFGLVSGRSPGPAQAN